MLGVDDTAGICTGGSSKSCRMRLGGSPSGRMRIRGILTKGPESSSIEEINGVTSRLPTACTIPRPVEQPGSRPSRSSYLKRRPRHNGRLSVPSYQVRRLDGPDTAQSVPTLAPPSCRKRGQLVPSFDKHSSNPSGSEAAFLREVLGPGTPRNTSLRTAAIGYRERRRRAVVKRAVIVLVLGAAFCGSAFVLGEKGDPAVTSFRHVPATDGLVAISPTSLNTRAHPTRSREGAQR
jgi:hypothetical protein